MTAPMKVGVIGTGGIAHRHFDGYVAAGAEVVAASDLNETLLAKAQRKWDVPRGYADYRALVADPEVEAVSICLPNALHHPATLAAAAAGKHVLCEKPISLSLSLGEEMIRACREAGVVLQIGHHLRTNAFAVQAKRMIEAGELGRLCFLRLRQTHDWGGHAPTPNFTTFERAGGGTLLDNGCHMMDLARYFAGNVREVYAQAATLGFDIEVEDTSLVSLSFESGAMGSVENAWTATGWEEGFWIYGTKGALEYTNRTGVPEMHFVHRTSPGTGWGEPDVTTYHLGGLEAHLRGVVEFVAAIQGEQPVVCTGEDGLEAVRLTVASYQSAREHRPVTLAEVQASQPV